jgi:hypothetical protein
VHTQVGIKLQTHAGRDLPSFTGDYCAKLCRKIMEKPKEREIEVWKGEKQLADTRNNNAQLISLNASD